MYILYNTFVKSLIHYIKKQQPHIKNIYYFTDGCAGQYKNRFNFSNISKHFTDFGLECEWHFFATSHGKSSCDGIGGTVKRSVARASLQRTYSHQILTPKNMFIFCQKYLSKNIKYFYTTFKQIENEEKRLCERFNTSIQIPGTRKYHKFVPINESTIKAFETSYDEVGVEKAVNKSGIYSPSLELNTKISDYIICNYKKLKWIGIVESFNEDFEDYEVNLLIPSGYRKYYCFPKSKYVCHMLKHNILKILSVPTLKAGTSRIQYKFREAELKSEM